MPANANEAIDNLGTTQISFSGCDTVVSANINGKVYILGSLETVSISTFMDTAPVRVLGKDAPTRYKQGTRTVSGTMIFSKVYKGEMEKMIKENYQFAIGDVKGQQAHDRLPPFDVTINVATEYSPETKTANLLGVTITAGGMTLSVHDVYTEQTYSFVALEYIDLHDGNSTDIGESNNIKDVLTLSSIYNSINQNLNPQGNNINE